MTIKENTKKDVVLPPKLSPQLPQNNETILSKKNKAHCI